VKREASKSRGNIIIKGLPAAQEKISITLAIPNKLDHGIFAVQPQTSPGGQLLTPNPTEYLVQPI
jgi:hypothetical protein